MGIEPTEADSRRLPSGFEAREDHQALCASKSIKTRKEILYLELRLATLVFCPLQDNIRLSPAVDSIIIDPAFGAILTKIQATTSTSTSQDEWHDRGAQARLRDKAPSD